MNWASTSSEVLNKLRHEHAEQRLAALEFHAYHHFHSKHTALPECPIKATQEPPSIPGYDKMIGSELMEALEKQLRFQNQIHEKELAEVRQELAEAKARKFIVEVPDCARNMNVITNPWTYAICAAGGDIK